MVELPYDMPNKFIDEEGVQWTYSRCFWCHANCGILVGVDTKTDQIVEIKPNPKTGTVLCDRMGPHGEKAIQAHYHPARINHPLKRAGERGEDKWIEISYDQALDEIAEKLQEIKDTYGPEALVASEGTYRSDVLWARSRFFNLFGNPGNIIAPGNICWCWNYTINMSMAGWPLEVSNPVDPMHCNTFVMWGVRASEKYGPKAPLYRSLMAAFNREGVRPKMITIDPACTETGMLGDQWLALRPGTDLIMMLAWINYIIGIKEYDEDFLTNWTNAPFLVRKDNGKMLRASEIDPAKERTDFVVWDSKSDSAKLWNSDKNEFFEEGVAPHLYGTYSVTLHDGTVVECQTAFDAIKEHVSEYTVEKASEICGVPESQIIQAAWTYATNKPSLIAWGLGGGDQAGYNAAYTAIAKTMLRIITGNIDCPGGEYIGEPGPVPNGDEEKLFPVRESELELSDMVKPESRAKLIGNDTFRIMGWKGFEPIDKCYRKMWDIPRPQVHQLLSSPTLVWDAIENGDPYPIKAMIAWGSNPMAWASNTKHVHKVLKQLDLLVVCDYWKTPTAALADYIMPVTDSLERPFCGSVEDAYEFMNFGDRGSTPVGERHTDYDFFRGLGIRLGQEEYWPWETLEDNIKYRISRCPSIENYESAVTNCTYYPMGTKFYKYAEELPNGETRGFTTVSRRCEIWSTLFEDLDYSPLPSYREPESPLSEPELAKEYPLRLTVGGRVATLYHSENRVPGWGTRSMYPYPTVQLNYQDARELGIRDGDWVWIETPHGRIQQVAKTGNDILKGVVQAQPSWWYPEMPAEEPWSQGIFMCGGNVLTPDGIETLDPATGNWCNRGLLCKIYPAIDPRDRTDQYARGADFIKGDSFFNSAYDNLKHWKMTSER